MNSAYREWPPTVPKCWGKKVVGRGTVTGQATPWSPCIPHISNGTRLFQIVSPKSCFCASLQAEILAAAEAVTPYLTSGCFKFTQPHPYPQFLLGKCENTAYVVPLLGRLPCHSKLLRSGVFSKYVVLMPSKVLLHFILLLPFWHPSLKKPVDFVLSWGQKYLEEQGLLSQHRIYNAQYNKYFLK